MSATPCPSNSGQSIHPHVLFIIILGCECTVEPISVQESEPTHASIHFCANSFQRMEQSSDQTSIKQWPINTQSNTHVARVHEVNCTHVSAYWATAASGAQARIRDQKFFFGEGPVVQYPSCPPVRIRIETTISRNQTP